MAEKHCPPPSECTICTSSLVKLGAEIQQGSNAVALTYYSSFDYANKTPELLLQSHKIDLKNSVVFLGMDLNGSGFQDIVLLTVHDCLPGVQKTIR